ncbi:leucine-rich repeat, immunoglobulin-like domain and transmembrane domain-containing protein 2 [Acomys russatus]|uniref:leucine-rich repeat, immunoglobulin-like domain and transmembrane domain-containing protein 2 n=1 Tax=Acomys russatus TaxID=60746 RepID=UPI0021E1E48A|nr:leucine-rich repeat, immunoglobulin-like domain and transmembrane domain-containing protein 2 [Acomys russatus]
MALVLYCFLPFLLSQDTHAAQRFCLPGCTCSEESFGRSLRCTSMSLGKMPDNFPEELKHMRIENSPLFELSQGFFTNMSTLEYLWLNFNNVTVIHPGALEDLPELRELRLEGNKLRSVPWTAFRTTPLLRVLDLKHNRIDSLPTLAFQFLANLTYLDISSNRLTVISKGVFLNWPVYQKQQQQGCGAEILSNVVLSLHNNPWVCDCRLRGLVQFVKSIGPPFILVNSYLICQGPVSKAGRLLHETELGVCMKPNISTPSANVTIQIGKNVTLQCLAQASPSPTIVWKYPLSTWREFDVLASPIAEDVILSQLVIPAAHLVDSGNYTCMAFNSIGRSSLVISLYIQPSQAMPGLHSLSVSSDSSLYIDLRVVKQTVHGILLEWLTVTNLPEEQWFTLYIASDESLRKKVVHIGPGINTYAVDDLLPATKYKACLSLRSQPPSQGQCVVFVTGKVSGGLEGRERLLHVTVVLCAVLLALPVGAYVWAAQGPYNCREWYSSCSPLHRKTLRCPQAVPQYKDSSFKDPPVVFEDGESHRVMEENEEIEKDHNS